MAFLSNLGLWIAHLWGGSVPPSTREVARRFRLSDREADRLLHEPDEYRAGGSPTADAILSWLSANGVREVQARRRRICDMLRILTDEKLAALVNELIRLNEIAQNEARSQTTCIKRIAEIVGAGDDQSAVLSLRLWADYQTESKIRRALRQIADAVSDHRDAMGK